MGEGGRRRRRGRALRILQVIDHLHVGGAQSVIHGLAEFGAGRGIQTYVASIAPGGDRAVRRRLETSCREVISLDGRALWDLAALARLVRVIRHHRIDVVHTHLAVADALGGVAAKLTRRPVVSSLHNIADDRYTHPRARRMIALFATRVLSDRLIAVSEVVRATHEHELGISADKLRVIRNVPIAPLLLPPDFDSARKRAELGVSGAVLCTVARLAETKDHPTLFRALRELVGRQPNTTLLVVGDGPRQGELEQLVEELELRDEVRFLGSRADVIELMAASDVVCNITLAFEGLPIAVLDAMSLGRPLVATRVDGVEEVVDDGRTGLLVEPGDVSSVRTAIDRLLADPARAEELGAAARTSIERQLDPELWIEAVESVYRELLDERGKKRHRIGSHVR